MECAAVFVKGYSASIRMHVFFAVVPPYRQRITPNHSTINRLLRIPVRKKVIPLAASPVNGLAEKR